MKYWIFYHRADMDGFASAYLFHRYFKEKRSGKCETTDPEFLPADDTTEFEYVPYNYNDLVYRTIAKMIENDYVIFADCLLYQIASQPTVLDIAQIVNPGHVYIFDHHKTALEWLTTHRSLDVHSNIMRYSKIGIGACEIVCQVLFPQTYSNWSWNAIKLISKHDVWDKSDPKLWNECVEPFMHYLKYCISVDLTNIDDAVELFDRVCDNRIVESCILDGRNARNVMRNRNLSIWKTTGFISHVDFQTLDISCKAAICSDYLQNSQVFEDAIEAGLFDPTGIDMWILMRYEFLNQKHNHTNPWMHPAFAITIYTKNEAYDGGKICSTFGGGGHVGAAGGYPKCIEIREYKRIAPDMPRDFLTIIGNAPVVWAKEELDQFISKN